jgi:hypothetical protein
MGCPLAHDPAITASIAIATETGKNLTSRRHRAAALDFSPKNNQMAASFHLPAAA